MDDKTFLAKFVADETVRINERLKQLVESPSLPSEEERDAILADIETTLQRLKNALTHIQVAAEEDEPEPVN